MSLNPLSRHRENCKEARASLSDYLDGELGPETNVGRHLQWCPNCRRMTRNLSRTVEGLEALGRRDRGRLSESS
jgi:predicted anti-sigma-YlaC factor YlaD